MSSLSVMEWNAKPPLQWEWETPVAPSLGATENIKVWQPTDWGIDTDEQIASGSLISYQGGCGSGVSSVGTSFDLGYASISKSSKSTSMSSSSTEDMKFSKFSIEACKGYPEDFSSKKNVATAELSGTSPTLESSVCSGEPLLSLKLGKRTYFEDISDGSNSKTSNFPLIVKSPDTSAKRIKSTCQNMPAPCCQVEGCNIDLSSAKDYHRKHRVCENHSKSPKVIVNGAERRFCQQCSRFHGLAEFDENKRSCRKRLSDHNARRRKPHPDVAHFNPARLSTIIYGELQQGNTVFSRIPIEHKSAGNITWSNTSGLKFMQAKVDIPKAGKAGAVDGRLPTHSNMLPNSVRAVTGVTDGSDGLLPLKGATIKILNGGSEESMISSTMDAPRDLHRALSLLSTDSRDSCRPEPIPQNPSLPANHMTMGMVKPWIYGISQSSPLGSTELWHTEQWPGDSQRQIMTPHDNGSSHSFGNNNFQECLLSGGQHEFVFDSMHLN